MDIITIIKRFDLLKKLLTDEDSEIKLNRNFKQIVVLNSDEDDEHKHVQML